MENMSKEEIQSIISLALEYRNEEIFTHPIRLSKSAENAIYYACQLLEIYDEELAVEILITLGTDILFKEIPDAQKKARLVNKK